MQQGMTTQQPPPQLVDYLTVWINIQGEVIEPHEPSTPIGTLSELVNEGWRIIHMNIWNLVQHKLSGAQFMVNLVTMQRDRPAYINAARVSTVKPSSFESSVNQVENLIVMP